MDIKRRITTILEGALNEGIPADFDMSRLPPLIRKSLRQKIDAFAMMEDDPDELSRVTTLLYRSITGYLDEKRDDMVIFAVTKFKTLQEMLDFLL